MTSSEIRTQHPNAFAWGYNNAGGLRVGGTATVLRPVPVHLPDHTIDVQGGSDFTVALTRDGRVWAWGGNLWGQLGVEPCRVRFTAQQVDLPGDPRITAISVGNDHVLALSSHGQIYAWGRNHLGQLGDGTRADRPTPALVPLAGVTAISSGNAVSAAITRSGEIRIWGGGVPALTTITTPGSGRCAAEPQTLKLPRGARAAMIDAGQRHLVVLTERGALLGYGVTPDGRPVPQRLETDPSWGRVTLISAGDNHTVALTRTGTVLTWGANDAGQLGFASTAGSIRPVRVRIPKQRGRVVQAVAGGNSVLVRTDTHRIYSWGQGTWGQHGTGDTTNATRPVAVPVPDHTPVTGLYTGRFHCFATTTDR